MTYIPHCAYFGNFHVYVEFLIPVPIKFDFSLVNLSHVNLILRAARRTFEETGILAPRHRQVQKPKARGSDLQTIARATLSNQLFKRTGTPALR